MSVTVKIKKDVDLNVLQEYGFKYEKKDGHGIWIRGACVKDLGCFGVDIIFVNEETRTVDYYNNPVFNYNLGERIKDLIKDDLVDIVINKNNEEVSDDRVKRYKTIPTFKLINKLLQKSDYVKVLNNVGYIDVNTAINTIKEIESEYC